MTSRKQNDCPQGRAWRTTAPLQFIKSIVQHRTDTWFEMLITSYIWLGFQQVSYFPVPYLISALLRNRISRISVSGAWELWSLPCCPPRSAFTLGCCPASISAWGNGSGTFQNLFSVNSTVGLQWLFVFRFVSFWTSLLRREFWNTRLEVFCKEIRGKKGCLFNNAFV